MVKAATLIQPHVLIGEFTAQIESLRDKRFVIKKAEAGQAIAKRCAADLCEGKEDEKKARNAFMRFISVLFALDFVPAVAFHSSRFIDCPATLTVTILHNIEPRATGAASAMKSLGSAFKALARELRPIAPASIRYVYAADLDIRALEGELRADWSRDPLVSLLGFGEFRRDVP
jgi:hypothetical protein